MKKKKILYCSDFSRIKTGFARNAKTVLKYLYETGKYEIIEYATAPFEYNDPALKAVPWKAYGSMPTDKFLRQEMAENEIMEATVKYGSYYINDIIEKEKPDCLIGVNDFWAFKDWYDMPWWNKVNSALWVTLDSLPIYEDVIHNAHKVKNFWVWSKFAQTELNKLGFPHVQTLHGAFDVSEFRKLENRAELRAKEGIAEDDFIVGFVFRNQPRKLIGSLFEGFAKYKKRNTNGKAKLLLHTSWKEGWDLERYMREFNIDKADVLTSHVCKACKQYTIKPYEGEPKHCPKCRVRDTLITPKSYFGVDEPEMNEIYNLMDFYIHPVNSGGQEMPIIEALMAGVPVATVNYSYGEEFCENDFVTTIDHSLYREFGTQFKKAQPCPLSIATTIADAEFDKKVHKKHFARISERGIQWAREQFDHKTICKRIEDWIDNCPEAVHDYEIRDKKHNADAPMNTTIDDNTQWAVHTIESIFGYKESAESPTIKKMVKRLDEGATREHIWGKAIKMAQIHNQSCEKNASTAYFPDEEYTNNAVLLAPNEFVKKLSLINLVEKLCKGTRRVYIVGDDIDREIYSQCGHVRMIPRTERSTNPNWLVAFKNRHGNKRFAEVYWEENNNLINVNNDPE